MRNLIIAGSVALVLCLQLHAAGNKDWSGREPHPAVVNPVCGCADGTVLDLGGEWTFAKGGYSADRSQFFRRWRSGLVAAIGGTVAEVQVSSSTSTYNLNLSLPGFRPWSPESPNLYTAKVELVAADGKVLQTRLERFGIRKLEICGKEIFLNNRPFYWRGVGFHEIDPINGLHPADRAYYRDRIGKIRACGFNAVRLHTRCEWPEFFEMADELGLLVQPELPYYGDFPVARAPFEPLADAEELYLNYRRHPSFAVYSGGNEGSFGPVLGPRFYREVKTRDSDRLVLEQTTMGYVQWPGKGHIGTTDFMSQPTQIWKRGEYDPDIPFLAHEYMNLAVKIDTRLEDRYTGVWDKPMTRADLIVAGSGPTA